MDDVREWRPLVRVAAVSVLATLVLIPVQLAVFVLWPLPGRETSLDWFDLLQDNRAAGLVALDLLLLVDWVLLLPVYLVFLVTLRRVHASWTMLGFGLWAVAFAGFLASNPSVEMASLSDRYALASSDEERLALRAAGEALLAGWDGTAFQVSYVLGQTAGILVGLAMLRSAAYTGAEAWLLVAGNTIGFGYYLPRVGLAVSAFSGLVLWVWYAFAARTFIRMGWAQAPLDAPPGTA